MIDTQLIFLNGDILQNTWLSSCCYKEEKALQEHSPVYIEISHDCLLNKDALPENPEFSKMTK